LGVDVICEWSLIDTSDQYGQHKHLLFIIYIGRFISMCQSQTRMLDIYRRESISALLFPVIYGCPVSTSFSVDDC